MNSLSNSQSLQRILNNSGVSKYSTVSKFLSGKVSSKPMDFKAALVASGVPATSTEPTLPVAPVAPVESIAPASLEPAPVAQVSDNPTPVENVVPEVSADLDLLDNLVEQTLQSRPTSDQISAATPARAKETLSNRSADQLAAPEVANVEPSLESPAATQEVAPASEMQELTKELQEVSKETKEQREAALIQEKQRAINDLAAASATPVAVNDQPVVVLPITAASKEEAKFKTTAYSVKWLWEWCQKIGKIFAGAVVYKEEVEEA